ncbi:uncharacterized protein IL334_003122 [Kwoniella shivajii]|uniref:DNA/RNA-binding protein Alba-like domain-containing protein n=1 Tax=Kwoniella shivajii TaxID=564305 RepID=A0ABZ1CYF1_9TREE|nr:hypothetical protein IL334_003122 [Kwoniella shivajii]
MTTQSKGKQPIRNVLSVQSNSVNGKVGEPYKMRITSGGSISSYVDFAVKFLSDNPHTPLILHTLPPPPSSDPLSQTNNEAGPSKLKSTTLLPCTTAIPRLISVAEIVKRAYLAEMRQSKKGKGIWQYTESSLYHPSQITHTSGNSKGTEENSLERVLGGKTKLDRPKMTHHPYLSITLSTKPLGLEEKRNVTMQYVLVKKKNRGKKGKGKTADQGDADEEEEQQVQHVEVADVDRGLAGSDTAELAKKGKEREKRPATAPKGRSVLKRGSDSEDRVGKKRKT